jgi:hypothetical protein
MDNIFIKLSFFGLVIISILKLVGAIDWGWLTFVLPFIGLILFDFIIYAIAENKKKKKTCEKIDKFIEVKQTRINLKINNKK